MGASSENIPIGKWFGPNAIVQVLKYYTFYISTIGEDFIFHILAKTVLQNMF
jgi:hypothetical protein